MRIEWTDGRGPDLTLTQGIDISGMDWSTPAPVEIMPDCGRPSLDEFPFVVSGPGMREQFALEAKTAMHQNLWTSVLEQVAENKE